MIERFIAIFFLAAFTIMCALTVSANTVREIAVSDTGTGIADTEFILAQTGTGEGDRLDRFRISRDVRSLLKTGRYSYVGVKVQDLDDENVRLTYLVTSKPKLGTPVNLEGARHFKPHKVREILDLNTGDFIDEHTLELAILKLKEKYEEDYYRNVSFDWDIKPIAGDEGFVKAEIRIDEGKKEPVKKIVFEGNKNIDREKLRKPFEQPAWWNPFKWFRKKRYAPSELEMARLAIEGIYLDEGFHDVQVAAPERTFQGKGGDVVIKIKINEGRRYFIGEINIKGNTLFPDAELLKTIALKRGAVASRNRIRESAMGIREYYGGRGYIDTFVRPVTHLGESSNIVNVVFKITEGRKVWIRDVRIVGNQKTKDKVIRREILVAPGDLYDEPRIGRSERRLHNLGFFSSVRSYPDRIGIESRRDLVFEVEEKPTGQFMVGAGFSSIENLIGFVQVQQGNFDIGRWPTFTGGGQKLKLSAEFGSTTESYELSFVEPWFLDRKLALGIDLYNKNRDYDDYDVEETGVSLSLKKGLAGPNSVMMRYRLENSAIKDVTDTNVYYYVDSPDEEYFFTREEDIVKSSLRVSLIHDSRNSPFVPTRGTKAVIFSEVSGGILDFDTDIYNVGFSINEYIPIWLNHVVTASSNFEVVDAYGQTDDVSINDRLFLGGGRTLRGFEYRDVGPKVIRTDESEKIYHRPIGGKSCAYGTVEYWIPVIPKIRFASFLDVGNVWSDSYDFEFSELAASYGAGIRLDIPGFPIRIDWAWPLWRDDDLTDTERFVFWIGYDR